MLDTKYEITCDASWACKNKITGSLKGSVKTDALGLGWHRRLSFLGWRWYCPTCRNNHAEALTKDTVS